MMAFQPDPARATPLGSAIDRLNAVAIGPAQLQQALERLASLPVHLRSHPQAQAMALQTYAQEEGFADNAASAALHARVSALSKWTAANDPSRQSNAEAVIEAAARFPLSEGEGGVTFEASGFQEMTLFLEELPF